MSLPNLRPPFWQVICTCPWFLRISLHFDTIFHHFTFVLFNIFGTCLSRKSRISTQVRPTPEEHFVTIYRSSGAMIHWTCRNRLTMSELIVVSPRPRPNDLCTHHSQKIYDEFRRTSQTSARRPRLWILYTPFYSDGHPLRSAPLSLWSTFVYETISTKISILWSSKGALGGNWFFIAAANRNHVADRD